MAIEQRKSQLVFTADTTDANQKIDGLKGKLTGLGEEAQKQSEKAAGKMSDIPKKMGEGMQASERQIRSMISAIQRAEAEAGAVSNKASDRLANLAKIRGIPQEMIEPYLRSLRATEEQQAKVTAGMNNMGLSAKQMQASLRGLPAQFTDIFTSLATGQAPITVLLQQGGQIKDMFGGMVPALKAVGGAIMAMINPWTIAAAAIAATAYAISQGAKEAREFEKALILNGNATGTTAAKLMDVAKSYSEFGVTQGKMAEAMLVMMPAVRSGADDLGRFSKAAVEMEKYGGTALKETAKVFKEIGDEPLKASLKANEGMNYLSMATYEYIKALEKQGRTQEAAKVAQEAYFSAVKERGEALKETLGYMERGWNAIADTAKKAWDMMVGLGRPKNPLTEISDKIAEAQKTLAMSEGHGNMTDTERERLRAKIEGWREEQRNLQETERMQNRLGAIESARTRQIEVREEIGKRLLETEDNAAKRARMILEVHNLVAAAGWSAVKAREVEAQLVAQINEKYKDKAKPSGLEDQTRFMKDWAKTIGDWQKISLDSSAAVDELSKSEKDLLKIVSDPKWDEQTQAFKEATFAIFNQAQAEEELAKAKKENDKAWAKNVTEMGDSVEREMKETKAIEDQTTKLRIHTAQLGLTEQAKKALTIAERELEIQRLQTLLAGNEDEFARDPGARDRINARIKALKELSKAEREAGEAGDLYKLQKEWDKTADQIEQSLTDALMRGFENGKSYGENVAESLKNSFKSFTAKLIIEPVIKSAMGNVMSFLGLGTQAGNNTNMGMLGNLFSMGGGGSSILSGLGGTDLGAILGVGAGGLMGSSAAYGAAIGSTSIGAGSQAAMLASQTGVFGGAGLSATAGAAGSSGLAAGASAIPVVGWIALAAYLGYNILKGNRARHRQAVQDYGLLNYGGDPFRASAPNIHDSNLYTPMLYPVQGMVDQYASMFGGDSSGLGYGLYSSYSPDGRGAQTVGLVARNGATLYNNNVNADNASMEARLKAEIPRMMLIGLQNSDLSKTYKEFFDKFDATRITEETLNSIVQVATSAYTMAESFKQLGGPFEDLTALSVEARAGILDLVGGLDQFMGKTSGYFNNFYSEQEKQAMSLASVDKTLTGVGLNPDKLRSKEDFRALVESLDVSTEDGQRKFAALMNSAEAFNYGVGLLDATGKTLGEITTGAPETAGIDLMVNAQATTNSLLEKIEAAIRDTGKQTVAAIEELIIELPGGGGSGGGTEVTYYGGTTGGGN